VEAVEAVEAGLAMERDHRPPERRPAAVAAVE